MQNFSLTALSKQSALAFPLSFAAGALTCESKIKTLILENDQKA